MRKSIALVMLLVLVASQAWPFGWVGPKSQASQQTIPTGTSAQYLKGDLTLGTLNQASVAGLTTADAPQFSSVTLAANGKLNAPLSNDAITIQDKNFSAATAGALRLLGGSVTNSSGTYLGVTIKPAYTQTSSGAATDLTINRTENSVGTGPQLLASFGKGGGSYVEYWGVNNIGIVKQAKGANVASASTITPTGHIFHVTGTTNPTLMAIPYAGWTGSVMIIPDGSFTLAAGGSQSGLNYPFSIASGLGVAVVGRPLVCTFDGTYWYPSY